jgi:hypothetical protein
MLIDVEPDAGPGKACRGVLPTFGNSFPDLLRLDTLVFVCDEVRERGWFFEHLYHASAEHSILDAFGRTVGRVTERAPRAQPVTLERREHLTRTVSATVYDLSGGKILDFSASHGVKRLRSRHLDWGRRLEVSNGAGEPVGTIETGELRRRATLQHRSGERIGVAKVDGGLVTSTRGWAYIVEEPTGAEAGWIAGARGHERRLARAGAGARAPAAEQVAGRMHHILAATSRAPDLRLMMLALAAGAHLMISPWSEPSE